MKISHDYEYDLEKRAFISKEIDKDIPVCQTFTIPAGMKTISGFAVKLYRNGEPGDIEYRIGSSCGADDIASGTLNRDRIIPFYELLYRDFFDPIPVTEGNVYYLYIKPVSGSLPYDGYRIFGPHPGDSAGYKDDIIDRMHWQVRGELYTKYVPQEGLPPYDGGYGIDKNGQIMWSISFHIYETEKDVDLFEQPTYECMRELLGSSRSEWEYIRSSVRGSVHTDDLLIGSDFYISAQKSTPVIQTAIEDFTVFMQTCMGVSLYGNKYPIELHFDDFEDESSTIEILPHKIVIRAASDRGILRALFYLEDVMRYRKFPALKRGITKLSPKSKIRFTSGYSSNPYRYFELEEPDIYTDEYLLRISRGGYNGIWLTFNMEQLIVVSDVFPSMADPKAPLVLHRLKMLTERAEKYGIDVYFEIRNNHYKPFDREIFTQQPDVWAFDYSFAPFMSPCTRSEKTIAYYKKALEDLLAAAPKVKGMILIFDTEGFYTCFIHNQNHKCANCKDETSQNLALELLGHLNDAIHFDGKKRNLILWTYGSQDSFSLDVLERCATLEDVYYMCCLIQFAKINRLGIESKVEDYAVCVHEASEYFEKVNAVAKKMNVPLIAKVEASYGQEFVGAPFVFALQQFQKKWDEYYRFDAAGFMGDYTHVGFYPGPCLDLLKLNCFEEQGTRQFDSDDNVDITIVQNYGPKVKSLIKKASQHFTTAFTEYFPYAPGVCRYPGPLQAAPSQPFYLDANRHVRRQRARGNVKDLAWTDQKIFSPTKQLGDIDLWDAEHIYDCFTLFNREYILGIGLLRQALNLAENEYKRGIRLLLDITEAHSICVSMIRNHIQFIKFRDKYAEHPTDELKFALRQILENEYENELKILAICGHNSIIGQTGSGDGNIRGGLYNPCTIREKMGELLEEIRKLI